jgi:hypothetical protein
MSKLVLVETVSMFRIRYAIELKDEDPIDYALDTVVSENGLFDEHVGTPLLEEMSQKHIDETVVSHREISKEEYLKIFTEDNGCEFGKWDDELKMRYIHRGRLNES